MSKLKIGDQVHIYGFSRETSDGRQRVFNRAKAEVSRIDGVMIEVKWEGEIHSFHEKQLRKLKPKKRREIWVNIYDVGFWVHTTKEEAIKAGAACPCTAIHFKEVLEK